MRLPLTFFLLLCTTALLTTGCQQKPSNVLEFDGYFCKVSNDKCDEDPFMAVKFKVGYFEKQVLLSVFDWEGNALGNQFLEECQIFNQRNWKCKDYEMVEGALINSNGKEKMHLRTERSDTYSKFVPRK